jgi:hypothetical protein
MLFKPIREAQFFNGFFSSQKDLGQVAIEEAVSERYNRDDSHTEMVSRRQENPFYEERELKPEQVKRNNIELMKRLIRSVKIQSHN